VGDPPPALITVAGEQLTRKVAYQELDFT